MSYIRSSLQDRAEDIEGTLSETVERAVREHLTGGEILSVDSRRSEDYSGDDIITVRVVVNAKPSDFDSGRLASLIAKLRNSLAGINEYAFPLVSFMSPAEHEARPH